MKNNILKRYFTAGALPSLAVLGALLISGCTSTINAPEYSPEGMKLMISNQATRVYKAEGVDFSQYDKIQFVDGTVAFKKDWQKQYNRSAQRDATTKVSDDDVLKIKAKAGEMLNESFVAEFSNDSLYTIVDSPDAKTLILRPSIVNINLIAPTIAAAPKNAIYTRSAGEATIFLEIFDGVTGQVLARVMDAEVLGNRDFVKRTNRATNYKDAKSTIDKWAKALREHFDAAKQK